MCISRDLKTRAFCAVKQTRKKEKKQQAKMESPLLTTSPNKNLITNIAAASASPRNGILNQSV